MPCACIDIGSNTTRLLVAEHRDGRLHEVLQERVFTKLGSRGEIPAAKIEAVAEAVAAQVGLARAAGADTIRAVGTHALRQAPNRDAVLGAIREASGLQVDLLTGDEEAAYAFRGATHTAGALPPGDVGVVDVGGGSTEIVVGTAGRGVTWSRSLELGSGVLTDEHVHGDPPAQAELQRVREHVEEVLAGVEVPRPVAAYAVGGSATSLRLLVGPVLDERTLADAVGVLTELPQAEVARRFGVHPERVRLLPAGIVLLDAVARAVGAPLQIAGGGLREGVLLEALDREGARG